MLASVNVTLSKWFSRSLWDSTLQIALSIRMPGFLPVPEQYPSMLHCNWTNHSPMSTMPLFHVLWSTFTHTLPESEAHCNTPASDSTSITPFSNYGSPHSDDNGVQSHLYLKKCLHNFLCGLQVNWIGLSCRLNELRKQELCGHCSTLNCMIIQLRNSYK